MCFTRRQVFSANPPNSVFSASAAKLNFEIIYSSRKLSNTCVNSFCKGCIIKKFILVSAEIK